MGVLVSHPPSAPPDVSIVRLHGESCWHCGAVNAALAPIGEVSTTVDGGRRVWTVVACADHRARRVAS